MTSVPLSIPTGPGDDERDGWANFEGNTGYEIEVGGRLYDQCDGRGIKVYRFLAKTFSE